MIRPPSVDHGPQDQLSELTTAAAAAAIGCLGHVQRMREEQVRC